MRKIVVFAAAVTAVTAALAAFPLAARGQGNPPRPGGRGVRPQEPPRLDAERPDRAALERRVRQRFAQMLRNRLGLTDAQMRKVEEINARYAGRRRTLLDQERDIRMSLREEIVAGDSTRQRQVAELLDRMMQAQRQRLDVMEAEQRDLAGVLTPLQRAQYIGMAEQIRQRVEAMRAEGGRMRPPGPRRIPDGAPPAEPPLVRSPDVP